mgnify:FL=1
MFVFVCSPYGGNPANIDRAIDYCLMEMALGNTPFAPHAFFTQMLDEDTGRAEGLAHGLEVLARCDELHYWGAISPGMRREIEYAESAGIPVVCMTGGADD